MASVSPTPTNPLLASIEAVTIGDVSAYKSDFATPKYAQLPGTTILNYEQILMIILDSCIRLNIACPKWSLIT